MPKPQKRDSDYFERRLLYEHPAIHADLKAGKFRTVNEAAVAAGPIKPPSTLGVLKRAWKKASSVERKEFINWARGKSTPTPTAPVVSVPAVSPDRYVEPWAKKRIEEIMSKRRISEADVMTELGSVPLDASLWRAVRRSRPPARIRPKLVAALEKWIQDNRHV